MVTCRDRSFNSQYEASLHKFPINSTPRGGREFTLTDNEKGHNTLSPRELSVLSQYYRPVRTRPIKKPIIFIIQAHLDNGQHIGTRCITALIFADRRRFGGN